MSQDIKDVMNIRDVKITDLSANPAPLGLMGFGMTTGRTRTTVADSTGSASAVVSFMIPWLKWGVPNGTPV